MSSAKYRANRGGAPRPSPATGDYLTEPEVAALIRLTPKTLRNWRAAGTGPAFVKAGARVLYSRAVVDAWLTRPTS